MLERILNFSLFENIRFHVKLVIYTMNTMFELSFYIHFTINVPSATKILVRLRPRVSKHFLHFAMQFWI